MEYSSKIENTSQDLMLMLVLNETLDQLAMASSVDRYGRVFMREDGHVVLRRAGRS